MRFRSAFSMLELIFVIVIMGIIGKFGVEFIAEAYKNFIFSSVNNRLQSESAYAIEFIATRLQYRIKDSVIAKRADNTFSPISSSNSAEFVILEWIGEDIDGFRGLATMPNWSGVVDLDFDIGQNINITSPATNMVDVNSLINILSYGDSDISKSALYFIGSESDTVNGYGFNGILTTQNSALHPITQGTNADQFSSLPAVAANFQGVDVYEYYKLTWSAYAVVHNINNDELRFYYDYQPWLGETYKDGKDALIMQDVDTFQFMSIGSLIKIQLCIKTDLVENYSLCKDKTVF